MLNTQFCENCKKTFEEPGYYKENHGGPFDETWTCCPYCKSTEFSAAVECVVCGEYFSYGSTDIYAGCCDQCAEESFNLETGLDFLSLQGVDAEKEFFSEIYSPGFNYRFSKQNSKEVLKLLKKDFIQKVKSEDAWRNDGAKLLEELKSWCQESPLEWQEYVAEIHKKRG